MITKKNFIYRMYHTKSPLPLAKFLAKQGGLKPLQVFLREPPIYQDMTHSNFGLKKGGGLSMIHTVMK